MWQEMVLDVVAVRRMGCSSRQIRRCRENMLSSTPQSFSMSVSSIENDDDILFAGVHIKLGTRWFNWSPARNLEAFHPDKRGCRNEKTPPSWIWPILACMKGWNHLRVSVPSPHFGPAGMISSWPARQSHLKAFSESSVVKCLVDTFDQHLKHHRTGSMRISSRRCQQKHTHSYF